MQEAGSSSADGLLHVLLHAEFIPRGVHVPRKWAKNFNPSAGSLLLPSSKAFQEVLVLDDLQEKTQEECGGTPLTSWGMAGPPGEPEE